MSALRYLSEADSSGADSPTIFLAIEEPELYQHPVRARHFSTVLEQLADRPQPRVQVLYATHSPYFVDARRFSSFRVLRRERDQSGGLGSPVVASASATALAELLDGIVDASHIDRRLARTIDGNRAFSEAFFSQAVVVTEGPTDAQVLQEVARLDGCPLERDGIVLTSAGGKTCLPIAYGVLTLLGIPAYVVFDGDNHCKPENREAQRTQNVALQVLLGVASPVDFPQSSASETWAVFENDLERALKNAIPNFESKCQQASSGSDWRAKSGDTYVEVMRNEGEAPALLSEIVAFARRRAISL